MMTYKELYDADMRRYEDASLYLRFFHLYLRKAQTSHGLKKKISTYQVMNAQLSQAIAEENGRKEELQTLPDYVKSDAFVEKTAREKFGLAYDNEVIFRAEDP